MYGYECIAAVVKVFCQSGVPSYFVELEDCIGLREGMVVTG
jgi:hypothetical protein